MSGTAWSAPTSQGTQWVESWGESWGESPQQPIDPVLGGSNPPTLSGQTVREIEHLSAGGTQIRLRLCDEYTDAPTKVGAVRVALSAGGSGTSAIRPGSDRVVTFGGRGSITLAPNAAVLSDSIDYPVAVEADLAVSI